MAGKKLYTGISLEDDSLKIARISVSGKTVTLEKLDRVKLVQSLKSVEKTTQDDDIFESFEDDLEDDSVFGLDEGDSDDDLDLDFDSDSDSEDSDLDDLDLEFDDLEDDDILAVDDMADDASDEVIATNELLVYNILTDLDSSKAKVSLNIPAGSTIFQMLKDVDFASIKKKDLQIIVDDRLESLYGSPKGEDFYSYSVRDDGSLLLVSIDDEPQVLQLLLKSEGLYNGKILINEILPDEALTVGLFRANYDIDPDSITALVQYGEQSCRVIFMKGSDILIVSPIIVEGSSSRKFLNTVFSKILFQLDTGEVPNLDRIILCNNTLGDDAISFFAERFPDIEVSNLEFKDELLNTENHEASVVSSFTTAIGLAWIDAGFKKEAFPAISFVPNYIKDRQKIFKLQWHGFLLLALILAVFPVTNYFYLKNDVQIESLSTDISSVKSQIASLESTVQEYNRINSELTGIQSQLVLLDELSEGTLAWSVNLDLINKGVENIESIWFTSISSVPTAPGNLDITGIATERNRIPMVADMFSDAVLLDVNRTTIREQEVFSFTYRVTRIVSNNDLYTPESAKGLREVLGDN